ncbi:phosphate/phosphite/phosphonate ABC transporter substrate-binding protein [Variovorax sp. WS11]|uniref:phosphate/phosphite/phosphonate ABC transporter substrate-binding protein n=1 Tax=Variovorax sp. WS11 TaxID=1105204 RepID=UPI000D0D6A4C|nr:phosphate/phosphite/phosphonate ABC transporter substrate-binding protein [Variovorax sp. WS11]NDZ13111.1 phosphate/phosphite/phosphonate ABC transporter substrate-binding protein [Variovorax sp. WS11]PSL83458.1 phosphate/phosphite/phosphonate ABC transporter substrate-binding protein [Variovorax sp. WS11]
MRRRFLCASALLAVPAAACFAQGASTDAAVPLRFGVLPIGGAVESRESWTPLLGDLSRALGRPVSVLSMSSYESLDQAIRRGEVDFALLSAKLALDAVVQQRMSVVAQVKRHAGLSRHRAVLLARKTGSHHALGDLLAAPERWRLARGDSRSVSGFIVPQLELFAPHGISMERFQSELLDTHQGTALAVANGDADVATNNTTDFERFRQQFPVEAARLQVIWESSPTPPALFVMRRDQPAALQKRLQDFLTGYGQARGPRGDAEREVLKQLHAPLGYVVEDNSALLPTATLDYRLARQHALNAKWVNPAAREARLERIERSYAQQAAALRGTAP